MSEPITTEELIRLIGTAFDHAANADRRQLAGWTSVEAFARITGMFVRMNAKPGQEENVLQGAIAAMHEGFDHLTPEDFLP